MKDEGGRRKDEGGRMKAGPKLMSPVSPFILSSSSFILHPS
jgi:hypothetical protein